MEKVWEMVNVTHNEALVLIKNTRNVQFQHLFMFQVFCVQFAQACYSFLWYFG